VLRSFGKFFGLAGVRLGFALADPLTAERLDAQLGPWAVAGPALEYGIRALSDAGWQADMRQRLAQDAGRLDVLLGRFDVPVAGGTSLFRYLSFPEAQSLFSALGSSGVLVRHFAERPGVLRVGLPGSEAEWLRLEGALAAWAQNQRERA
jgi:cobalamin biosynthetic protein CobC